MKFSHKMFACERLIRSSISWPVGGSVKAGATNCKTKNILLLHKIIYLFIYLFKCPKAVKTATAAFARDVHLKVSQLLDNCRFACTKTYTNICLSCINYAATVDSFLSFFKLDVCQFSLTVLFVLTTNESSCKQ